MMTNIVSMKRAPSAKRSTMDTLQVTIEKVKEWKVPPFQRPIKINTKVRMIAEQIKEDGIIPGILTLGIIERGPLAGTYIIDGQHRIEAFKISGVREAFVDVRISHSNDFVEMGAEFVELNSSIVKMTPDDMLRGMEASLPAVMTIRARCPFVGYTMIRRNDKNGAILSMSVVLRTWIGSAAETPVPAVESAVNIANDLDLSEAERCADFLLLAFDAWGRSIEVNKLWGRINLLMVMWLWRQIVLDHERGLKRAIILSPDQFKNCLMSLGANSEYNAWLVGRNLPDRDRSPCYDRVKKIFTARLKSDGVTPSSIRFPNAPWANS